MVRSLEQEMAILKQQLADQHEENRRLKDLKEQEENHRLENLRKMEDEK
jgi:hypothetical protein